MNELRPSSFLAKNHRLVFYGVWLLIGLIQSGLTELLDDEAYYWVYSKYFDWGYFDHPPMTGLLIKIGYSFFPNELGVRLLPLLLNLFSLVIIEKLTVRKNPFLFYAIVLSVAVLQISGFVAVPDIPLIFFTALFFLLYKKFIDRPSLVNTLLLGFCITLLLYSKYHAVLIVLFTVLSNLKLLTRWQLWLAGLISIILFMPHLWWQYEHNWVSFRYHLFESNVNAYKLSHTTDYLLGQILLAGPLAGFILLPAAFLYKTKTPTEKALRFTMVGTYVFFFLMSFRGKIEANWTAPAIVPLLVLSHQYLGEPLTNFSIKGRKWLYRLLPATMVLVIFARVAMIIDFLPIRPAKERFHSWKKWPAEMRQLTGGHNIVFSNSYQRASKYWFYTGQMTVSQGWYVNGRNNYNFWPIEDSMLGKPYYFLDNNDVWRFPDSLRTPIGYVGYRYDSSLASFMKVNVATTPDKVKIKRGETVTLQCRFEMPDHYARFIREHPIANDTVRIGIFGKKGWIKDNVISTPFTLKQMERDREGTITFDPKLPQGKYFMRFSIKVGKTNSTHNSEKITLIVE